MINTPPTLLKSSNISLLSYSLVANLDNKTKADLYKAKLKSSEEMIPYYPSSSLSRITAVSKSEAARTKSDLQSYTFERLDQFIDSIVCQGMQIVELTWNNNGSPTKTLCAVSDKEGVVYDNFISNLLIIEETITTNSSAATKTPVKHGEESWTFTATATWITGGERGRATISQSVFFYYGRIMIHNYSAGHEFTWGNSNAQVPEVEKTQDEATIAYGYGFATAGVEVFYDTRQAIRTRFQFVMGQYFRRNGAQYNIKLHLLKASQL